MPDFTPIKATRLAHMGSDKTVVDAARVSFAKYGDMGFGEGPTTDKDADLIAFLASGLRRKQREELLRRIAECDDLAEAATIINEVRSIAEHWTPFGHCTATFHIRAPIFVHRQITRSGVGLVINEESRRYVGDTPEFFAPSRWRTAPVDAKQGSGGPVGDAMNARLHDILWRNSAEAEERYINMIAVGVAPEQARMLLPLNTHTQWVWTGSLYAWARISKLRLATDAQSETREVAQQISDQMSRLFPISWRALVLRNQDTQPEAPQKAD